MVAAAQLQVGVREATGHNDGVEVEAMLAEVGMPAGANWCGALAYHCMQLAGVDMPGPAQRYAWVPSWFPKSRVVWSVDEIRRTREGDALRHTTLASGLTPGPSPNERGGPRPGDVFSIYFTGLHRDAHMGVVVKWEEGSAWADTFEGNTGSGLLNRDGNGAFNRRRLKSQLHYVARWAC